MNLIISKEDGLSAYPLTGQGFGNAWHGVRATYGFTKGKVFYEVKVMEHLSIPHLEANEQHPHVIRVGWSVNDTGLMLGEEPLSYGYSGTAKASSNLKFKDYGIKFGKGDVVGCFLDLDVQPAVILFTVNGEYQGIAYEIRHREIGDAALFPHIVTKKSSFQVNFGQKYPWFEPLTGYTALQNVPLEERILAMQGSEKCADGNVRHIAYKKQKCTESWKAVQRKAKRDSGKEYIATTGAVVAGKHVGPACSCPWKCYDLVTPDHIQVIFDKYWEMACHDRQTAYLANCVTSQEVKRSRVKGRPSKVSRTLRYTVKKDDKDLQVCRTAFLNIHAVSVKRVRNAVNKMMSSGTIEDKRGKHVPGIKIATNKEELVREHILSLHTVTSQYIRAKNANHRYLPAGLNRKIMYDLYKRWMVSENKGQENIVKEWKYCELVNEYNISFEPPKSDSCNVCDEIDLKVASLDSKNEEDEIHRLKVAKLVHMTKANEAQNLLKDFGVEDKPSQAVICMDLQQTMPTPKLTTGLQYYKRKMWTFNFGIHDVKRNQGYMYVWNETIGRHGSCEVASCLDHFIENHLDSQITKLVVFSDSCSGQNKNRNIILSCLRKIHSGHLESIQHYFMVTGHSYLPCNHDFELIELKVHPVSVFSTPHYIHLIEKANRVHPFRVIEVKREFFKDYDVLQKTVSWAGMKDAGLLDARVLCYSNNYKAGFQIQSDYGGIMSQKKVNLEKKKDKGKLNLSTFNLPSKYPDTVLLSKEKLADLKSLMMHVDPLYKPFYTTLISEQEQAQQCAVPVVGSRGQGRAGVQPWDDHYLDDDPKNPTMAL
ncbi:uncharacterized protein LOC143021926 isoform X2 [Oratosquilla oratoria]